MLKAYNMTQKLYSKSYETTSYEDSEIVIFSQKNLASFSHFERNAHLSNKLRF